jgi:peroxin-4
LRVVISSWTLESTCRAIIALLGAPDATSPLNCDAGNLIRAGDMLGFHNLARMYTLEYGATTLPPIATVSKMM